MLEGIGYDASLISLALTHHSVTLTAASLPIGKNRAVVALNYRLNQRKCCFIINLPLSAVRAINSVKRKVFFSFVLDRRQLYLVYTLVNGDANLATLCLLILIHRSGPNYDLDALRHLLCIY